MDCRSCQGGAIGPRPQRPVPPCMNTNCDRDRRPPRPEFSPRPAGPQIPAMTPGATQPLTMQPGQQPLREETGRMSAFGESGSRRNGGFPENTPIGMGYVPMQQWGTVYPADTGFQRGTIFPELDLPFQMGRCRG